MFALFKAFAVFTPPWIPKVELIFLEPALMVPTTPLKSVSSKSSAAVFSNDPALRVYSFLAAYFVMMSLARVSVLTLLNPFGFYLVLALFWICFRIH